METIRITIRDGKTLEELTGSVDNIKNTLKTNLYSAYYLVKVEVDGDLEYKNETASEQARIYLTGKKFEIRPDQLVDDELIEVAKILRAIMCYPVSNK